MTWLVISRINLADEPDVRAKEIEDGIAYGALLLFDEYERSAADVEQLLEAVVERVYDEQYLRDREQ